MTKGRAFVAWDNPAEIEIVVETVLSYVRRGWTMKKAFDDLADTLDGRTAKAIKFHWDSKLRRKYDEEFIKAKEDRARMLAEALKPSDEVAATATATLEEIDVDMPQLPPPVSPIFQVDGISQVSTHVPVSTAPRSAREVYTDLVNIMDEALDLHKAKDALLEEKDAEIAKLKEELEFSRLEIEDYRQKAEAFENAKKMFMNM